MRRDPMPLGWILLVVHCLGASERLARQLWRELDSPLLRWHLACYSALPTPDHRRRLLLQVSPKALIDAAEQLCVSGACRRQEVATFQEQVLIWTQRNGTWV